MPPISGSDLARVAGIQLKHHPRDLVRAAATFGQKIKLIGQAYVSSLIIDATLLGFNQFGLIVDKDILIYALLPNPLYKRMKHHQQKAQNVASVENEYLPMCADLFSAMHIYSLQDQNFGDSWKQPQTQLFNDFWRVEEQTFRITAIEQAIREYISTGRIARRPPNPQNEYLSPIYVLKTGRYFESQVC
ncbi:MAG: hypothetical protein EZS28_003220 [Streblomastix strix]|uniref:Uncharacterized protein n=1 Tax=Streblomastix strix TaxID=222440 RepID=A0A5J4X1P5_9EUKA|nr:MAG: hypothetical protein EZS28_003220 [Streblomastix strix]